MRDDYCPFQGINAPRHITPGSFRAQAWSRLASLRLKLFRAFERYAAANGYSPPKHWSGP